MQDDAAHALREALVAALAAEHRLRRAAHREHAQAERWTDRVAFALQRGLQELAASARGRAEQHVRRAELVARRAAELHEEVDRLRASYHGLRRPGRAPPALPRADPFVALEIERDLDAIRRRVGERAAPPED